MPSADWLADIEDDPDVDPVFLDLPVGEEFELEPKEGEADDEGQEREEA